MRSIIMLDLKNWHIKAFILTFKMNKHQQQRTSKLIKVLLCQLNPILKQRTKNIEKANLLIQDYSTKDNIGIILFPQMSFVGYNFANKQDACPLSIEYADFLSQQFKFVAFQAKRLNCYAIFGYIEKHQQNGQTVLYNSAAVINREGQAILNYRKTHMYYNDELWCQQGDGFKSLTITNIKGEPFRIVLGICMDIDPKNYTSGKYELADYAVQNDAQVLLFLTNWVDNKVQVIDQKAVQQVYKYWLERLSPITKLKRNVLFFAADRTGIEYSYYDQKNIPFYGASCAMQLNPFSIIGRLSIQKEQCLLIQAKIQKQSNMPNE